LGYGQVDSAYIEFIPKADQVTTGVFYAANGYYKMTPSNSYKRIIPGMVRIKPVKSVFSDSLFTVANQSEMPSSVSFKYPFDYYLEITEFAYNSLMAVYEGSSDEELSIEALRMKRGLKFEDISDLDKKRLVARFDFAEIEKNRIKDSITNVRRKKLLMDLVKTPVKRIQNLDTLPIPDPKYFKRMDYFEAFPHRLDSMNLAHQTFRKEKLQTDVDHILQPYYFSKTEISNSDYREFTDYIIDSLILHYAYWNIKNDSLRISLLDCSNKERELLDASANQENYNNYGLKRPFDSNRAFRRDESWFEVLDPLYYQSESTGINFNLIEKRINYPNRQGKIIEIYPDTLGLQNGDDCLRESVALKYNWHSDFDDYPVLNVSYNQMEAYCLWKERQLQKAFHKRGFTISVGVPSLSDYEFAVKSVVPEAVNRSIVDQPNANFISNPMNCGALPFQDHQKKKFIDYLVPKRNLTVEQFQYNKWLQANKTGNLKFINGNASEYSSTPVTRDLLAYYGIAIPRSRLSEYVFVLGSNYHDDVLTKTGTSHNKIFYKTIQRKDESSPFNGFRVVYKITPLDQD
jgi:hypothetical protein